MTARTPTYLKARFEQGDYPQGTDYEDLFDSYLNVATSAIQTIVGGVVFTNQVYSSELNAALVSATSGIFSFVSAQTINAGFVSAGNIDAGRVSANNLYSSSATFTTLNATNANLTTVTANDINVSGSVVFGCLDVSALATTQAGAITITGTNNFIIFADGNNNAVKLPVSVRGREQRIINASTTVLKVFPSTSGRFLVTAVNASLNLPADRVALVIHKGDDRYGFMVG